MTNRMVFRAIVATAILVLDNPVLADAPAKSECSGQRIAEEVYAGNFDAALTMTDRCVEFSKSELARAQAEEATNHSQIINVVGLAELNLRAYLVAKPEILALKGAFLQAESAIADAEASIRQQPHLQMDWSSMGFPLVVVRAFLLEKKGDLKGAVEAYQKILKDSKARGWMSNSSITEGRAALAALAQGDDTPALRLSKETLAEDPGANVALAKVLEKRGDKNAAKECYTTALKLMSDGIKSSNWNLPLFFAEHKSAQDGAAK